MEEGLFAKYSKTLNERKKGKSLILDKVKEKTKIELTEEEITLTKKQVVLCVSSVKKAALLQSNIKEILEAEGYSLKS